MKGSLPALMSPCGCLPVPSSALSGPWALPWESTSLCPAALMSGRAKQSFRLPSLHFYDFNPHGPQSCACGQKGLPLPWASPEPGPTVVAQLEVDNPWEGLDMSTGASQRKKLWHLPHSTTYVCLGSWAPITGSTSGRRGGRSAERMLSIAGPPRGLAPPASPAPGPPPPSPSSPSGEHSGSQGDGSEWEPITALCVKGSPCTGSCLRDIPSSGEPVCEGAAQRSCLQIDASEPRGPPPSHHSPGSSRPLAALATPRARLQTRVWIVDEFLRGASWTGESMLLHHLPSGRSCRKGRPGN